MSLAGSAPQRAMAIQIPPKWEPNSHNILPQRHWMVLVHRCTRQWEPQAVPAAVCPHYSHHTPCSVCRTHSLPWAPGLTLLIVLNRRKLMDPIPKSRSGRATGYAGSRTELPAKSRCLEMGSRLCFLPSCWMAAILSEEKRVLNLLCTAGGGKNAHKETVLPTAGEEQCQHRTISCR